MKEIDWMTSSDSVALLEFSAGSPCRPLGLARESANIPKPSARKLRLLACAFARQVWESLYDDRSRHAVEVAERFADGLATTEELFTASRAAREAANEAASSAGWAASGTTACGPGDPRGEAGDALAWSAVCQAFSNSHTPADVSVAQANLVRDVVGNLFSPYCVRWSGGPILSLAREAYDTRDPESGHMDPVTLAVLADALEDAGCHPCGPLVTHLRSPDPHVRGCWAVDLLLGRE